MALWQRSFRGRRFESRVGAQWGQGHVRGGLADWRSLWASEWRSSPVRRRRGPTQPISPGRVILRRVQPRRDRQRQPIRASHRAMREHRSPTAGSQRPRVRSLWTRWLRRKALRGIPTQPRHHGSHWLLPAGLKRVVPHERPVRTTLVPSVAVHSLRSATGNRPRCAGSGTGDVVIAGGPLRREKPGVIPAPGAAAGSATAGAGDRHGAEGAAGVAAARTHRRTRVRDPDRGVDSSDSDLERRHPPIHRLSDTAGPACGQPSVAGREG